MELKNKIQNREINILNLLEDLVFSDVKDKKSYFNIKPKWGHLCKIPKHILIDENFVEGVAYYIGDGRTKTDRGLSIVDVDKSIIDFFIMWLQKYLRVDEKDIKIVDKVNYTEAGIYRTILKRLFDRIKPIVKNFSKEDKNLARAYLRGIFAAESSVKYNVKSGSRAIHLKMADKKEIEFIKFLLDFTEIKSGIVYSKRENEWIITISGIYQLETLKEIDLFRFARNKKEKFNTLLLSYKRKQTKKGNVANFYLSQLNDLLKIADHITAPELAKHIKRDRTRTITVLRQLEREGLLISKRIVKTGRPFTFQITEKGRKFT